MGTLYFPQENSAHTQGGWATKIKGSLHVVLPTLCIYTLREVERMSNMSRIMTAQEALEYIFDQDSEVEEESSESEDD